jgi:hypothetical protein
MGSNAALRNRSSNLVPDWMLSVIASRDEELVLDVDEMFAVMDDLDICICD